MASSFTGRWKTVLTVAALAILTGTGVVMAQEPFVEAAAPQTGATPVTDTFWQMLVLGLVGGLAAVLMAVKYKADVMKANPGNARMQEIAGYVRDGAMAYLNRQFKVVVPVLLGVGVLVAFGANYELLSRPDGLMMTGFIFIGFVTGGLGSFYTGWAGMNIATHASSRTAWACTDAKNGLNAGLQVAFKAGSVMGLSVVGVGLLFTVIWLGIFATLTPDNPALVGQVMVSFGMGASMVALFARVGGGIYTKAADVGADLVGKVEAGIPEDDPRNPATIADNVGDNVGDVAGMGADLYESYLGSILAAIALAAAAAISLQPLGSGVDDDHCAGGDCCRRYLPLHPRQPAGAHQGKRDAQGTARRVAPRRERGLRWRGHRGRRHLLHLLRGRLQHDPRRDVVGCVARHLRGPALGSGHRQGLRTLHGV
jgi:hypothetical protein